MKNTIAFSVLLASIIAGVLLVKSNQNINEEAAAATTLSLNPASQEIYLGNTFAEQVMMNTGANEVTGIDIQITYDSSKIFINEIRPSGEISDFTSIIKNEIDNVAGKLRYTAFTPDRNLSISGNLNILTLYGGVPSNSTFGSYQISFDPETLIIAVDEGENVLTSSTNGTIQVVQGQPNSCGGTCGSNDNCQSNLFCYQGYCRNPSCQSDTDCSCSAATAQPTTAPTARPATARPTVRPVTTIAAVATRTPTPSPTPIVKGGVETPQPNLDYNPTYPDIVREPDTAITTDDLKNQVWPNFIKYTIGALILLALIIIYSLWKKHRRGIPHILPPTNI